MRIAFITNEYAGKTTFAGGLGQYVHRTAEALTDFGHEVEVFVPAGRDETVRSGNVLLHHLFRCTSIPYRVAWKLCSWLREPLYILGMNERIRRKFIERHAHSPFDIVQSHSVYAPTVTALRGMAVPVVTRASSYQRLWSDAYRRRRTPALRCRERMEVRQMRASRRVYAPSRLVANALREHEGIEADVLEPPFFLEERTLDPSLREEMLQQGPYVLFVGTLGRMKGIDILARSLETVFEQNTNVHAILAGADNGCDGETGWVHVQRRLQRYTDRIRYAGKVPHERLYPLMAAAAAVALPSRVDNLPNACMEAMALGGIVIGTDGASFEQLIDDGRTGYLVPRDDPEALAQALRTALQLSSAERRHIGKAAQARIDDMTPERSIPKLVDYYQSLLS